MQDLSSNARIFSVIIISIIAKIRLEFSFRNPTRQIFTAASTSYNVKGSRLFRVFTYPFPEIWCVVNRYKYRGTYKRTSNG